LGSLKLPENKGKKPGCRREEKKITRWSTAGVGGSDRSLGENISADLGRPDNRSPSLGKGRKTKNWPLEMGKGRGEVLLEERDWGRHSRRRPVQFLWQLD